MRMLFTAGFCVLLLIVPGRAQEAAERSFIEKAVKQLNGYATQCLRNGFPRRAREVWLEIIAEYDVNDRVARRNLGFVQVGAGWAPKSGFDYPEGDKPDITAAKLLQRRWESLIEDLGKDHRELALALRTAGL